MSVSADKVAEVEELGAVQLGRLGLPALLVEVRVEEAEAWDRISCLRL
jgi:hypothetical protein